MVPERDEDSQMLNVQSPAGMFVALVYRGVQRRPEIEVVTTYVPVVAGWAVPVSTVGVDPDDGFAFS